MAKQKYRFSASHTGHFHFRVRVAITRYPLKCKTDGLKGFQPEFPMPSAAEGCKEGPEA